MKKIAVILAVVLVVVALSYSYQAYKERTEDELANRRKQIEERDAEAQRQSLAKAEAQRLASLQADQAAAEADRQLEALKQQQREAEQQRLANEAERARLNQELENLRRQRDAVAAMVEKSAVQRQAGLATIAQAQSDALAKLRAVENEKSQLASREAAHAAALQKQMELEKQARERASRYRDSIQR
jgi:hypothetical protein